MVLLDNKTTAKRSRERDKRHKEEGMSGASLSSEAEGGS